MKNIYQMAAVGVLTILTGCAAQQSNTVNVPDAQMLVDKQIQESATKIQISQAELYQAGMLSKQGLKRPVRVTADQQPVSIKWSGDAAQLLKKMSSDRGLQYYQTGVEQPLPISLNVQDRSYDQVMQMIQAQVGYRAQIIQDAKSVSLRYQRPENPVNGGGR